MNATLELGQTLGYCAHLARLHLEMGLRPLEVTPVQAKTIFFLSRTAPDREVAQRDLERELGLKPSTVNGIVERLEEKGMIRREISPTDGRCRLVRLTDQGREACQTFQGAMASTEQAIRAPLSSQEQAALGAALSRIIVNLENEVHHT